MVELNLSADTSVVLQIVAIAAMLLLLLTAACFDLAYRTIPDWVCGALAAVGFASRAAVGLGAVAISAVTAAVVFAVLAFAHARGFLGGGVIGILYLALRCLPPPQLCPPGMSHVRRLWIVERWRWRRKNCLPYGVAIAFSGVWV